MTMMPTRRPNPHLLKLVLLAFLFGLAANPAQAMKERRVLNRYRPHKNKVRGDSSTGERRLKSLKSTPEHSGTINSVMQSYYGSAFSGYHSAESKQKSKVKGETDSTDESAPKSGSAKMSGGKGGKGGSKDVPATKSVKKSSGGKGKGGNKASEPKSQRSEHHSQRSSVKSMKSMKSSSNNIFDHPQEAIEVEIVPVECGSEESPFLTTFVASIQLQPLPRPSRSRKQSRSSSSKQKSTKKKSSKQKSIGVDDEDGDAFDFEELPIDALAPGEQRRLERIFRNVYNNWTFYNCDGFFRTVYSVSLRLVMRDEDEEEYSVTLETTYHSDGSDAVEMHVTNGTMPDDLEQESGQERRRLTEFEGFDEEPLSRNGFNESFDAMDYSEGANVTEMDYGTPVKDEVVYDESDRPSTNVQTVTGGDNLPIYFVSLAATCRNCAVTAEVNFPLLMHPEEFESSVEVGRQGEVVLISAPVDGEHERERLEEEEEEEEDVCTCPLPVEDDEEETSRRRRDRHRKRRRQRRRLDDLYVPPPNGPTAEQYVALVNAAIREVQETEGNLLRVAGIVELIEPDYFQGENPELATSVPTISAMPTSSAAPTEAPTISAAPTATTDMREPTRGPINSTLVPTAPVTQPPRPSTTTLPITPRPSTAPPSIAPTSAAAPRWMVSLWWALAIPAFVPLWC